MNKKIITLTIILLTFTVFISGCIGQTSTEKQPEIKSQEEASKAISNISQDVKDVSSTLEDIDKSLG